MADPYDILGIGRSASEQEVKSAYRKLAKELHPDRNRDNPNAAERFNEISSAYTTLSDPRKRELYDQYGDAGVQMVDTLAAQGLPFRVDSVVADPVQGELRFNFTMQEAMLKLWAAGANATAANGTDPHGCEGPTAWATDGMATLRALPIFVFAYTCHQNVISTTNEMAQPTRGRIARMTTTAVGTLVSLTSTSMLRGPARGDCRGDRNGDPTTPRSCSSNETGGLNSRHAARPPNCSGRKSGLTSSVSDCAAPAPWMWTFLCVFFGSKGRSMDHA